MSVFYPSVNALGVSTQGNTGGNTGTSNGTWVAVGSNNITISQSTGTNNVHSLFFSGPTAGGGAAFSGGVSNLGNTAGTTGTVSNQILFAGGNNITLSQSSAAGGATITVSAANQSNQQLSLYAVSNTTQATSGTANASNISFHGAGIASVGVSNGSVVISVPSGGGAGDGVNILAAGSQTANTTGTVLFQDGNGIAFGMNNSSVITASYARTDFSKFLGGDPPNQLTTAALGQNSCYFTPFQLENNLSVRYFLFPALFTVSSSAASSGRVGRTFEMGLYSRAATNDTVLTQFYSTTHTIAGSYSSNASMAMSAITGVVNSTSYGSTTRSSAGINMSSSFHGNRYIIFPVFSNISPGDYWLGFRMSSSSAGTVGNMLLHSHSIITNVRPYGFGVATNGTDRNAFRDIACGVYSATSNALPAGVSFTQMTSGAGSQFIAYALNTTI